MTQIHHVNNITAKMMTMDDNKVTFIVEFLN